MTEASELVDAPAGSDGEPVRGRWARRLVAGIIALGLVAGGVGTAAFTLNNADDALAASPGPGPRELTKAEAQTFAGMRYQNFRTRGVHVRVQMPMAAGPVVVVGDVDYARKLGFAKVTGAGAASGIYQWTPRKVLTWPRAGKKAVRPAKVPDREFTERRLEPGRYPLDALLSVLLQVGSAERPDDVAKVRRSATFLRVEGIDGVTTDVIAGARRPDGRILNYWVDTNGRLHRITVRMTPAPAVTRIDVDPRAFRTFPRADALAKKPKPAA